MTLAPPSWPAWPRAHDPESVLRRMEGVLASEVWTVRASGSRPCLTEQAEAAWARRCEVPFAYLVSSGSAAMEIALRAAGVRAGDDVVVPALGWYATAAVALRLGCRLVFADIDPATSCVSPESVAARLTDQTTAIVAVHLHCAVADITKLAALASDAKVALIEDCAQAHGAAWDGRPVGRHGTLGCFSFNQEKLLPAGEGGAVITDDAGLAGAAHALRTDGYRASHGEQRDRVPDGGWTGGNACPSEFQASVLLDQLHHFDELQRRRLIHAENLEASLAELSWVRPLDPGRLTTTRSWYEFGLVLELDAFRGRGIEWITEAMSLALAAEVQQTDRPPPESQQLGPAPPALYADDLPQARSLRAAMLVFPHRLLLHDQVADRVSGALRQVQRAA